MTRKSVDGLNRNNQEPVGDYRFTVPDAVTIEITPTDIVQLVEIPPQSFDGLQVDRLSIYSVKEPRWALLWQRIRNFFLKRGRIDAKPIDEAQFYRRYALRVSDDKTTKVKLEIHHTNDADILMNLFSGARKKSALLTVGLDTETSPVSIQADQTILRRRVAPDLVQFALGRDIILIHVPRTKCATQRRIVAALNKILKESNNVVLSGVNIENDLAGIRQFPVDAPLYAVDPAKALKVMLRRIISAEMSHKSFVNSIQRTSRLTVAALPPSLQKLLRDQLGLNLDLLDTFFEYDGLKELSLFLMNVQLPKQPKRSPPVEFIVTRNGVSETQRRKTSWDRIELDPLQIAYAALDGWASRESLVRIECIFDAWIAQQKHTNVEFLDFISDACIHLKP